MSGLSRASERGGWFPRGQKQKPQGAFLKLPLSLNCVTSPTFSRLKQGSEPARDGGEMNATSWWQEWHRHNARGHTGWEGPCSHPQGQSILGEPWFCYVLTSERIHNIAPEGGVPLKALRTQASRDPYV